jgi:hypothetical protein
LAFDRISTSVIFRAAWFGVVFEGLSTAVANVFIFAPGG